MLVSCLVHWRVYKMGYYSDDLWGYESALKMEN